MNSYPFLKNYSSDRSRRESLYPLFERVFQIPGEVLRDFYARGFWNPTYRPYTFFDGDVAIANASMFTLPLLMGGKRVDAAGIQSVMTHPDYRKKGLMRELCGRMLADIDQEFETAWLFTEIPELYAPFGFRVVPQHSFTAAYGHRPGNGNNGLRRIDFEQDQDIQLIWRCFENHQALSRTFAPLSYTSSFFLHLYSPNFQKKAYFADGLDAIVVFEVREGTLHVYDIIGHRLPSLPDLFQLIPDPFSDVTLHFCPDLFPELSFTPVVLGEGGCLMARGSVALGDVPVRMPITAAF